MDSTDNQEFKNKINAFQEYKDRIQKIKEEEIKNSGKETIFTLYDYSRKLLYARINMVYRITSSGKGLIPGLEYTFTFPVDDEHKESLISLLKEEEDVHNILDITEKITMNCIINGEDSAQVTSIEVPYFPTKGEICIPTTITLRPKNMGKDDATIQRNIDLNLMNPIHGMDGCFEKSRETQ
ncbi:MAG: hypothetical protein JW791_03310 [Nanoarchaeota archaeon]|nr:hypothetical protein [Nanoarchaeota archaeon]